MHQNPNELITIRGHTLTVLEAHAIAWGSVGLFLGVAPEASEVLRNELHYVLGTLFVTYLIGRWIENERRTST